MSRARTWALGLFLAAASLGGCRGDEPGKSDEAVLIMLSEARAHQRLADLKLADGDVDAAVAAVREVLRIRFPPGAPETEDVFLDAHARLARLLYRAAAPRPKSRRWPSSRRRGAWRPATASSARTSRPSPPRSTRRGPSGSPIRPSRSRPAAWKCRPSSGSSRSIAACSMHSLTRASRLAISRGSDVCSYLGPLRPETRDRVPPEATRAAGRGNPAGRLGALLTVLVTLGSGCAMQQRPTSTSPAASREHGEVAELEKLIADHKASLHSSGDDRPSAAADQSAGAAPAPRCDGVCRAGQEICTASRRICKSPRTSTSPPSPPAASAPSARATTPAPCAPSAADRRRARTQTADEKLLIAVLWWRRRCATN
ncbi:MAG: hypothetical protein QM769_03320 [Pseudoxanthomonas sp.]